MTNSPTDDVVVLPWWQNPLNFIALGLAMLLFGAGIGYWVGDSVARPDRSAVDEGFLQDMRYHHDQAVDMAFHYLTETRDPHPRLLLIAKEIFFSQQLETGRMIQLLRSFKASEVNDTGVAMAWMGHEVPIDDMDGLATQEELDEFARASGDEASRIFATLMIDHHLAGIDMAEYAIENASNTDVVNMAISMVKGQDAEVGELRALLETLPE
ncbi:MAG: DUF305 domain-containing protein [Ilumatobacteraceae bacterium]